MKRTLPAIVVMALSIALLSCGVKSSAWKSPADSAELSKLEAETLKTTISTSRRAQLFFLWGQELANLSRSGGLPAGQGSAAIDASECRERAIAAFEKALDLRAGLTQESRINLEILWREKNQNGQNGQNDQQSQSDQQNQKDQEQNSGQRKDNKAGKDGQGKDSKQQQDNESGKDQSEKKGDKNGQQNTAKNDKNKGDASSGQNGAERDLSGLTRESQRSAALDDALKAELERAAQKQEAEAGGIRPVEKDW